MTLTNVYINCIHNNQQQKKNVNCWILCMLSGIIANCVDYHANRPWQSMVTAFRTAGISLKIKEMTWDQAKVLLEADVGPQVFFGLWEDDYQYMLKGTKLPFVFACMILLVMTEKI